MKKALLTLALVLSFMTSFATVKLDQGSVTCLKGEHQFDVILDLSNTKYLESRSFDDFLALVPRDKDWEAKSLRTFSLYFNQISTKYGLMSAPVRTNSKYVLNICPTNVDTKGRLKGTAVLTDSQTSESVATFIFETKDGDNDDEITLQDPLSELGEDMAKLMKKLIK